MSVLNISVCSQFQWFVFSHCWSWIFIMLLQVLFKGAQGHNEVMIPVLWPLTSIGDIYVCLYLNTVHNLILIYELWRLLCSVVCIGGDLLNVQAFEWNSLMQQLFLLLLMFCLFFWDKTVTCILMARVESIQTWASWFRILPRIIYVSRKSSMNCTVKWAPPSSYAKFVPKMIKTYALSHVVTFYALPVWRHGRFVDTVAFWFWGYCYINGYIHMTFDSW